ncbi:MAG TPA: MFS transporter [Firmicutes bacterium]|nr:MFS transporter [Candidatus Fermentithermobacillaceae bacterium]
MQKCKDIAYSLGNFSAAVLGQTVSTFAIFYYVDVLKVPSAMIMTVMTWYGIWNAINDPLFGQISDKTKTRWGRRIPYILFLTFPLCLSFALLWMPPFPAGEVRALYIYYFAVIFVFDGLFTIVVLNWTALFPEMYPDLEDRARVSAIRQVLGILGLILGVALPSALSATIGWKAMGILFGALSMLTMYVSLWGAKERPEFAEDQGLGFIEALKATYINKSFITYLIPALLIQYTFEGLPAVVPFYTKYVLKMDETQTSVLLGALFIAAIPFAYVWGKLTSKLGPKKSLTIACLAYAAALVPFFFAETFVHGVLTCLALSFGLAGIMVLLDVFIADIADEDELKTGSRREGMYFGVNGFMIRLGISLNALIMGKVLDATGYDPHLAVQPESAVMGLRLLMSFIPMAAIALAIIVLRFYPLDGERLAEVKRQIAALHAEKSARGQRPAGQ